MKKELLQQQYFEQQVRRYQGLVFSIAFGILLEEQESMDVVQETFLKAYLEKDFARDDFDQKSWLIRVARNGALNVKKSWWKKIRLLANFYDSDIESGSAELADFFAGEQAVFQLKEAMKSLSDSEREIVALRFAGKLKYEQIALTLDIKIGTVMSRLARVKEKLGSLMGDESND